MSANFDRDYLMGQLDGHQRLLAVQDRFGITVHRRSLERALTRLKPPADLD